MALVNGKGVVNGYHIMPNAFLVSANLSGADLQSADLRDSFLTLADLSGAFLVNADLRDTDLRGADLRTANLSGANLAGADLMGANFAYATVDPAHVPLIEAAKRIEIESLTLGEPIMKMRPDGTPYLSTRKVRAKSIEDDRSENPGYGYNYEEDPYDDLSGGYGYGRVMNPGHLHHRRGYGR